MDQTLAWRDLDVDLSEVVAADCSAFIFGPRADNPDRVGKPLRNALAGFYAARRGEFRVIYAIHADHVAVREMSIRHRRDAYA